MTYIRKSDVLSMENGKKVLPAGVVKIDYSPGGYRLKRRVVGKDYSFGHFKDLRQAIQVNNLVTVLINDYKKTHKEKIELLKEMHE